MYQKNRVIIYLIAVFFTTAFITSCDVSYITDNEVDEFEWDGQLKVPLGFINYSVSEIFSDLGSEDFTSSSNEEFSFSYTESFSSQNNDAFNVGIADQTIEDEIIVTTALGSTLTDSGVDLPYTIPSEIAPGIPHPLINTFSSSQQTVKDLELSQELTEVLLDGGTLVISLNSNSTSNKSVTIELPSFTKKSDQSVFRETIQLNGSGQERVTVNLNEYNLDLTNDGTGTGKTVNTIVAKIDANFTFSAGNVIAQNDNLSYNISLSNLSYEAIFGDFKQEAFNVSANTISLGDFFDNFSDAEVDFDNIQMGINITNDFGFPIGLDLSSIRGIGGASSTGLTYTGGSLPNILIINKVENFGDDAKVTDVILNKENSNIEQLLKEKPTSLEFDLSGSANPLNTGGGNRNFYASDNTGLTAEIEIIFEKLSLIKTVDFDGSALEELNSVKLIAAVENRIPLGGEIMLDFKDSSGLVVHSENISLFTAADVNAQGESDGVAKNTNFTIDLTNSAIKSISTAETIAVKVTLVLPTSANNSVVLKGADEMNITVGLEAEANISANND